MERINEKRLVQRKPFTSKVGFEISFFDDKEELKQIKSTCDGVDLSSKGIGLISAYSFSTGEVIKVFLPQNLVKSESSLFAEVRWTKIEGERCRAGLRFLVDIRN